MPEQVLDCDRQLADPVAGRVIDSVGNRGRGANLSDLPDALDP